MMTGGAMAAMAVLMAACSSGSTAAPTTTGAAGGSAATTAAAAATRAAAAANLAPACPATGSPSSTNSIQAGGTHTYYTFATTDYASIVSACNSGLRSAGWTVVSSGGGGYGRYGGGGSTATKGAAYGTFSVGSSGSSTYMDVCVWPARPATTNCNQNSNQQSDNDSDNQNNNQQSDNDSDNQTG